MIVLKMMRACGALATAATLALAAACTSTSLTAPDQQIAKCQVSVTTPAAAAAAGGNASIGVSAAPECAWTASTQTAWISDLTPASGQGAANVQFTVAANPAPAARQGEIVVNGVTARVSQEAAPCSYAVNPTAVTIPADGGSASSAVVTTSGCTWTAVSQAPWLTVTAGQNGDGNGTVAFTAAPNLDVVNRRTGNILVAGQSIVVTQPARSCQLSLSPSQQSVAAPGGSGTVTVTTLANCAWTAAPDFPWISVTGSPGTGPGSFTYTVAANSGSARSGQIVVGGEVFTIAQAAAVVAPTCSYSIAPSSQSIGDAGGTGSASVTTPAGCAWSTTSNAPWLTVTGGASASGPGSATFSIAQNPGAARTGTLSIAGQTFTVNQSAAPTPCAYTVAPLSQSVAAAGGTATPITVTTTASCAWSATTAASWLHLSGSTSGPGSGAFSVSVDANTGAARSGTIDVAGQAVTINQAAAPVPCSYTVSPLSPSVSDAAGTLSVSVTTTASCAWSATTATSWLHLSGSTSGPGSGTFTVSVDANTGAARSGTIDVAGQTVTVNQAAPAAPLCTYQVTPTTHSIAVTGGPSTLTVTTTSTCAWTAVSNDGWITITSVAGGPGSGSVDFAAAANTGGARTGTLTVAGTTVSVNQAALVCNYSINPSSETVPASAGTGSPIAVSTALPLLCTWSAGTSDSWIHLSASSGSGNGTVAWTYDANTGAQRMGTIGISGQTFAVTQTGCSYMLDRTSESIHKNGRSEQVTVTAAPGCMWTASTSASWITITSGATGSGNGTVSFDVPANNTGVDRMDTITIAGIVFTVTQDH